MRNSSLAVFVPTYDYTVHIACSSALYELGLEMRDRKTDFAVFYFPGDAIVSRVRNACAAKFLHEKRFTHMLFVDADIGFSPKTVLRMLKFDEPVTCAAYPKKTYRNDKPKGFVPRDLDHFHRASLDYTVSFGDPRIAEGKAKPEKLVHGFAPVETTGTGMLMIRRDAYETMMARIPELRYRSGEVYSSPEFASNWHGFFDPFVDEETQSAVGEDTAFCLRWRRRCGGEIWCDLEATLSHYGQAEYRGSISDTMSIRRNAEKNTS
jgi:hypothetical protein